MKVYTVGYESCEIDEFVRFLKQAGIRHLADLRKNPVSRKRGFSKRRLAENLLTAGIEYFHLPALGVPSAWRKQAKARQITRKKMFSDYVKKVLPKADLELQEILRKAKKSDLAVLCYEADASDCHRSFVTNEIQARHPRKVQIVHLQPHANRDFRIF